jgi:DNA-binding GntR family transcriptional regulator
VNKQERTYTILRERIQAGAYAPGARLNIEALARELGVSPIPVREALRRLEAEGWVQFKPNIGAIVSPVDATTWEHAMTALAVLEGAATAEALPHLRKTDFARLRRISAEMEDVSTRADPFRFEALNREFHSTITARCPNGYLLDLLNQTHVRLDRVRSTMFVYLPQRSEEAVQEHVRLLSLLHGTDREAAEIYARWHRLQTLAAYQEIHVAKDRVLAARRQSISATTSSTEPRRR